MSLAIFLYAAPVVASPVPEPVITPAPLVPTKTYLNLGERSLIGNDIAECSAPVGYNARLCLLDSPVQ